MEILDLNHTTLTIHTLTGTLICTNTDEFNKIVAEAKRNISKRTNPLERFEFWEIPDNDHGKIGVLLMARARTREEKDLIKRYKEI